VVKGTDIATLNPSTSEMLGINTTKNYYSNATGNWFIDNEIVMGTTYNYGIYPSDNLNTFNGSMDNVVRDVKLQTFP
jgi:hypothetical protein